VRTAVAALRRRLERLSAGHRLVASLAAWLFLLVLAVLVLLPFRADRNVGAIALVLLLPPLAATGSGPVVAAAAALVTGLAFNFFFTKPYNSPRIASSASIAAFVVYVVIALTIAVIASRLRAARTIAQARARDATLLQTVTAELIRNAELGATLRSALVQVTDALQLHGAYLRVEAGGHELLAGAGDCGASERLARALAAAGGAGPMVRTLREPDGPAAFPVATTEAAFGVLVVDGGPAGLAPDAERVAESFAGVVALALARARLAEERIRRAALEQSESLRRALLQSASHDLRTPLTTIKATASTLVAEPEAAERVDLARLIERESDRLSRLVANLLDLSRIESGALQLQRSRIPVDELVYEALESVRPQPADDQLELDLPDGLPVIDGDETLLRQALVNVLENAFRHGAGSRAVRVTASAGGGRVEIRVVDHGRGIPVAERERVFEPYHRLRRPDVTTEGSGLGLAIARGFAIANDGTLGVEPTPGGGATFVLGLPTLGPEATAG
jgi:two-component system, OmpR family, sensor histidine kinase KdpD